MANRTHPSAVRANRFLQLSILVLTVLGPASVVWAQPPALPAATMVAGSTGGDSEPRRVRLFVGRSTVLDVGSTVTRVSLTSADVADALVTSSDQLLIHGKMPGTISMFIWDRAGALHRYEVVVQRDLAALSEQVHELFPDEKIEVQSNGKNIVLAGTVSNKDVIEKAVSLAAGYVDKREEVVTLLQLQQAPANVQVLLRVRFAEVSRTAMTALGTSLFTSANGYKDLVARSTTEQFAAPTFNNPLGPPPPGTPPGSQTFSDFLNLFLFDSKYQVGTVIQALQTKGLFQSLAEPNVVAESGKEASFLAGGEIPIPIAQASGGGTTISVQYKEYGIRLNFTPLVSGDRVHLKVRPEVSTLDYTNAITLQGFRIPALSTRRTDTELELANGQTFAIAGLLNNTVNSSLQKIPGIGDIPILGLLFQSKSAEKDQTELVVMITPEILPNNSPGVTPNLPRTPEPYLAPLPNRRTVPPTPPAFEGERGAASPPALAARPVTVPSVTQPVAPATATSAAAMPAAATPAAATPGTVAPEAVTPAAATPAIESPAAPSTTVPSPGAGPVSIVLPATPRLMHLAEVQSTLPTVPPIQPPNLSGDKDRKAQKLAQEAAKRDGAGTQRAEEEAEKRREQERERQRVIEEAEARLKAAQAAYDAEPGNSSKP